MAVGEGPQGNHINQDTYKTSQPPTSTAVVTAVKVINGSDKKWGPPKPGTRAGAGISVDCYFE